MTASIRLRGLQKDKWLTYFLFLRDCLIKFNAEKLLFSGKAHIQLKGPTTKKRLGLMFPGGLFYQLVFSFPAFFQSTGPLPMISLLPKWCPGDWQYSKKPVNLK